MLQWPGSNWRGHNGELVKECCNAASDSSIHLLCETLPGIAAGDWAQRNIRRPANLVTDTCWLLLLLLLLRLRPSFVHSQSCAFPSPRRLQSTRHPRIGAGHICNITLFTFGPRPHDTTSHPQSATPLSGVFFGLFICRTSVHDCASRQYLISVISTCLASRP